MKKTLIISISLSLLIVGLTWWQSSTAAKNQRPNENNTPQFATGPQGSLHPESAAGASARERYGKLPLSFERNQGQSDRQVQFISRGSGYTMFLTGQEIVLALRRVEGQAADLDRPFAAPGKNGQSTSSKSAVLRMRLGGPANPAPQLSGVESTPEKSNYLRLDNSAAPVTDVQHFSRVKYTGVYPGIDLLYYGNQNTLEYDFIVAPGANPSDISLVYTGADRLEIEPDGALAIRLGTETVRLGAPVLYQESNGERQTVAGKFRVDDAQQVSFEVGAYDHNRELVIDPTLVYATYLGGNGADEARGIALDAAGNAYIAGSTLSTNFPTVAGSAQVNDLDGPAVDAFVTKLNPAGNAKIYSTYLGAGGDQLGRGIAVDSTGRAIIVGVTSSTDPDGDVFVARLNAAGSSVNPANGGYTMSFGGGFPESPYDVVVDTAGNAYISGSTFSANSETPPFPLVNAVQPVFTGGFKDAFLTKVNPSGVITYSTYIGLAGDYDETGFGVAIDGSNNMYLAGWVEFLCSPPCDSQAAFIVKVNAAGSRYVYSGIFGGSNNEQINDIAVDSAGAAYVTGTTNSPDFPTAGSPLQPALGGGRDAFFAKIVASTPPDAEIVYSTFLGTATEQLGNAIALDPSGNVYIGGRNTQTDPDGDAFVLKLIKNGSQYQLSGGYSYTFGGTLEDSVYEIAVDASGNVFVAGATASSDFPSAGGVQGSNGGSLDALVAKIGSTTQPARAKAADFDGDGKADVSIFRPSNGTWYVLQSANNQVRGQNWGAATDIITPGDFDGDGKTDFAVFRPAGGTWHYVKSTGGTAGMQFGASGDRPVAGDYDGDGKTDFAVWRPSNGTFYIFQSGTGTMRALQWGTNGDKPVVGDYDGDGAADPAVFRPSTGTWHYVRSTAGTGGQGFGLPTDLPVQGDYDGDGKTDVAVFRPSTGVWYINRSSAGFVGQSWGGSADIPTPGDFDGDGKYDIAVFRPSAGTWHIIGSSAGFYGLQFGTNGDRPVEAAYLP